MNIRILPLTDKPVTVYHSTRTRSRQTFASVCRALPADSAIFRKRQVGNGSTLNNFRSSVLSSMPKRDNMHAHTQLDYERNGVWAWYTTDQPVHIAAGRRTRTVN